MSCHHAVPLLTALPLLFAACAGAAPPPPVTTAGPPARQEGYVEAGNGVRLFYRLVGSGRDTVVVIHGGPGFNMEYLAADMEPLAARHAVLFYDQRGTGRSTLVTDSIGLDAQRFVEDLEALRSHFGVQRLNLLGHSWGAAVAALYASRYPERTGRMLIVGGIPARRSEVVRAFADMDAGRDSVERRQMQEWWEARTANPGDAAACHAYYVLWFRPFFADPAAGARSRGDFCAGTPESRTNKMRSVDRFTMASLGDWDWVPSLRGIMAPTLVVHGSVDPLPLASARTWAAALPNGRILVLDRIGHFSYVEAPERFFVAVDEFLRGSWPRGAQRVVIR